MSTDKLFVTSLDSVDGLEVLVYGVVGLLSLSGGVCCGEGVVDGSVIVGEGVVVGVVVVGVVVIVVDVGRLSLLNIQSVIKETLLKVFFLFDCYLRVCIIFRGCCLSLLGAGVVVVNVVVSFQWVLL